MKNYTQPTKDSVLKDLLQQVEQAELPIDFSKNVMSSIRSIQPVTNSSELKIPIGIKAGIPLFLAICFLLIFIFPGNQNSPIELFVNNFSDSGFISFFDSISQQFQSFRLPELQISKKFTLYFLGGIVLIWMYILSEGISRRSRKSTTVA